MKTQTRTPTPTKPLRLPHPAAPPLPILLTLLSTFLILAQSCQPNFNNCLDCINGSECRVCAAGFGLIDVTVGGGSLTIVCQGCAVARCAQCNGNINTCNACVSGYGLLNSTSCGACSLSLCIKCSPTNASVCIQCQQGYGPNPAGECVACNNIYCLQCPYNYLKCTYCDVYYGPDPATQICQRCSLNIVNCAICYTNSMVCDGCFVYYGVLNNVCVPCYDPKCYGCTYHPADCFHCVVGYGYNLGNGVCQPCISVNCVDCNPRNLAQCAQCTTTYGVNSVMACQFCIDVNCQNCPFDSSYCQQCKPGYGFQSGTIGNLCQPCQPPCQTCSPFDSTLCLSCIPGYIYDNSSATICTQCTGLITYCLECTNSSFCTLCQDGYFADVNGACGTCNSLCSRCVWNTGIGAVDCLECGVAGYELGTVHPYGCLEVCGDGIAITTPCDLPLGILYDGCDDNCQIQPGFQCSKDINTNISTCSYQLVLDMQVISIHRQGFNNYFTLILKISPPLHVLQTSTLAPVFTLSDPTLKISSITLTSTDTLELNIQFTQNLQSASFQLVFAPSTAADKRYFASVNASVLVEGVSYQFYGRDVMGLADFVRGLCYGIVGLGSLAVLIGIGSRRLAGLQAMFVYQMAWVSILFLNTKLQPPFLAAIPLKYSSGLKITLLNPQPEPNSTTRLLLGASSSMDSTPPHLKQFQMDQKLFGNNFNVFLFVQVVVFVWYLVMVVVVVAVRRKHRALLRMENQEEATGRIKAHLKRAQTVKQFSAQLLLTLCLFNLINFTVCTYLLIIDLKTSTNMYTTNLALFGLASFTYLATYIAFCCDPDPFDYYRYAFRKTMIGMWFYYVFPFVIGGVVGLVVGFGDRPWIAVIPIVPVILYILLYQPYKQPKQNLRSAINLTAMLSILSLRIMAQYLPIPSKLYIFLTVNLIILFTVCIISYVSLIYNIYYQCYVKVQLGKKEEQKIMNQLEIVNVRKNMREINIENSVFKKLLEPKMNILGFSNAALKVVNADEKGFEHEFEEYSSTNTNKMIKKQLQAQTLRPLKSYVHQKKSYINQIRQKLEADQQLQDPIAEPSPPSGQPKQALTIDAQKRQKIQLIYAMDVMQKQNSFIRLKNANDYTRELIEQELREKAKGEAGNFGERLQYREEYENI